eukprot:6044527-Prorocentrum_lima.AAC.1
MTSSLVGSEMCIRDRTRTSHQKAGRQAWDARCEHHCGFRGRQLDAADKPVSYTHLTLPTICSV